MLSQLDANLPQFLYTSNEVCYIEPFVGGGAMLFHMLQKFPNITRVIINDINEELIACYRTIKDTPTGLVSKLKGIEDEFLSEKQDVRQKLFYAYRDDFNNKANLTDVDKCALFIFLNRTCFNGLFRVNLQGGFNVPYGYGSGYDELEGLCVIDGVWYMSWNVTGSVIRITKGVPIGSKYV